MQTFLKVLEIGNISEDQKRNIKQHLMYALAAEGTPEGIKDAISMADTETDLPSLVAACYAYKRSGKNEKALANLQAAQHSTQDPNTNYIFAYVLADEVDGDKVMPLLEAALATDSLFVFRRDAEQLKARLSLDKAKKNKKGTEDQGS